MTKEKYSISINASREKVWQVLFNEETYTQWTVPFTPGSVAITDWQEGSSARFVDGTGDGMISRIEKRVDNEYLSIEHIGMIQKGESITSGPQVAPWKGSHENYILSSSGSQTLLEVEMDTTPEMLQYFQDKWPKALQKVKELAEQ